MSRISLDFEPPIKINLVADADGITLDDHYLIEWAWTGENPARGATAFAV